MMESDPGESDAGECAILGRRMPALVETRLSANARRRSRPMPHTGG